MLADADVVLLAVPTPLSDGSPDLRPVRAATEALARVLRPGTLVVLESRRLEVGDWSGVELVERLAQMAAEPTSRGSAC